MNRFLLSFSLILLVFIVRAQPTGLAVNEFTELPKGFWGTAFDQMSVLGETTDNILLYQSKLNISTDRILYLVNKESHEIRNTIELEDSEDKIILGIGVMRDKLVFAFKEKVSSGSYALKVEYYGAEGTFEKEEELLLLSAQEGRGVAYHVVFSDNGDYLLVNSTRSISDENRLQESLYLFDESLQPILQKDFYNNYVETEYFNNGDFSNGVFDPDGNYYYFNGRGISILEVEQNYDRWSYFVPADDIGMKYFLNYPALAINANNHIVLSAEVLEDTTSQSVIDMQFTSFKKLEAHRGLMQLVIDGKSKDILKKGVIMFSEEQLAKEPARRSSYANAMFGKMVCPYTYKESVNLLCLPNGSYIRCTEQLTYEVSQQSVILDKEVLSFFKFNKNHELSWVQHFDKWQGTSLAMEGQIITDYTSYQLLLGDNKLHVLFHQDTEVKKADKKEKAIIQSYGQVEDVKLIHNEIDLTSGKVVKEEVISPFWDEEFIMKPIKFNLSTLSSGYLLMNRKNRYTRLYEINFN